MPSASGPYGLRRGSAHPRRPTPPAPRRPGPAPIAAGEVAPTGARPGPSPPLPGATATLPPSARWGWGGTYLTRMATPTSSQLA